MSARLDVHGAEEFGACERDERSFERPARSARLDVDGRFRGDPVTFLGDRGVHKLSLSVWPHNAAAIALYRKYGFAEEGRRVKHIRRQSGELWDIVEMGLLL